MITSRNYIWSGLGCVVAEVQLKRCPAPGLRYWRRMGVLLRLVHQLRKALQQLLSVGVLLHIGVELRDIAALAFQ